MEFYTQANDGYVTELGIVRTLLEYGPIVFGLFCAFMLIAVWVLYKKGYFGAMVLFRNWIYRMRSRSIFSSRLQFKGICIWPDILSVDGII